MKRSFFLCGVLATSAAARAPLDKPNVVLFFVDDLGYGDTGFTGHPTTKTPQIDKLAFSGKVLTTWYSACPVCSCSRASLMTGRQWSRMGIPGVFGQTTDSGLPLNETTLASQLKTAGYATGACGKWHLGQREAYLPAARGFDAYLGIPFSDDMGKARASPCDKPGGGTSGFSQRPGASASESAIKPYVEAGLAPPLSAGEADDPGGDFLPLVEQRKNADGTVNTTVLEQPVDLTNLSPQYRTFATSFIDEHKDEPFFLYLPFSHVHTTMDNQPEKQCAPPPHPRQSPPLHLLNTAPFPLRYCDCEHKNATRRGAFGDALAEIDTLVGQVAERLKANGIEGNTLILFTADNGPWLVQGTSGGSEGLLSARYAGYWNVGKGSTWEGGIREAGFAHWPGVIEPFTRSAEIVSSMDVFPTVLGLAGVPLPTDRVYDGRDFKSILFNESGKSLHDILFFYGGAEAGNDGKSPSAARFGPYKAHFATGPGLSGCGVSPSAPVGCPTLKYSNGPLLFNVEVRRRWTLIACELLPHLEVSVLIWQVDPSEAHPLSVNTTTPKDPHLASVIATIMSAYEKVKQDIVPYHSDPAPDGPGEKKGEYGICCNRTLGCDCNGPPST